MEETHETTLAQALADHLRAASGDRHASDAINAVVAACRLRLEKFASRLLLGHPEIRRGGHDTDDIVQDASVRLWRALEQVKPESERHLMALASMKVRQQVIDLARKYRGPRSSPENRAMSVVHRDGREVHLVDEATDAATGFYTLDDWTRLHAAIDRLPEDLREVFAMRFYLGAKVTHIATVLACDTRTVKRRWAKAVDRIARDAGIPKL